MKINLKLILDINETTGLSQPQKNLISERIKIIKNLYMNYNKLKEEKKNLMLKKLLNNQIIEETKRRNEENNKLCKERINELNYIIQKKETCIKKCDKKFNEIQIYIRRESQNYPKYKKLFGKYILNNFILENENLLRLKDKLKTTINNNSTMIPILVNDIIELKERKIFGGNTLKKNKNINSDIISLENRIKSMILVNEEKIKNLNELNNKLEEKFKKIKYVNNLDILNNGVSCIENSKGILNENICSVIYPNAGEEISEINFSNIYCEGNNKNNNKNGINDNFINMSNTFISNFED